MNQILQMTYVVNTCFLVTLHDFLVIVQLIITDLVTQVMEYNTLF